ncbi:MAG: hypothetical protein DLM72_08270 [Candidatus Nitrosopolaris wilkensis]|nr:MAG: hypothetical protein DLM72_08270 [Candidatus Nitrosopolaris wilkensis]
MSKIIAAMIVSIALLMIGAAGAANTTTNYLVRSNNIDNYDKSLLRAQVHGNLISDAVKYNLGYEKNVLICVNQLLDKTLDHGPCDAWLTDYKRDHSMPKYNQTITNMLDAYLKARGIL